MEIFWEGIGVNLLKSIPGLIAWITGVIVAVIMIRRGGAKAEKLLLIGCSLMLFNAFANPFLRGLTSYLAYEKDISYQVIGWIPMPLAVISLGGFICLVWSFWLKFWKKRKETV
ncbi:hypothetical protein ACFLYQ_05170 [Chloroflexota bacterium]